MFFNKIESISTSDLEKMSDVQIIDVREKDEYAMGHIPGAKNLPLSKIHTAKVKGKAYLICQSGMRSKQAASYLRKQGCDVVNVNGGMMKWMGKVVR